MQHEIKIILYFNGDIGKVQSVQVLCFFKTDNTQLYLIHENKQFSMHKCQKTNKCWNLV